MSKAHGRESVPDQEVFREALRLFPRLARDAGYLAAVKCRSFGDKPEAYGLFTRRNGYRRPVATVTGTILGAFSGRDWIVRDGDRWTLSAAGSAWLSRRQAGADPFREQHQLRSGAMMDVGGGVKRPVVVNDGESPLGWLRRRKGRDGSPLISTPQYEAGERLRADFIRARLTPRVTASWGLTASSRRSRRSAPRGPADIGDDALAAKQRVMRALESVGPELAGILIDVCCYLRGLEDAEKTHGWPRRSGKVILQIALTSLARHYGLAGQPNAAEPVGRALRHWGADDFKPSLDRWR